MRSPSKKLSLSNSTLYLFTASWSVAGLSAVRLSVAALVVGVLTCVGSPHVAIGAPASRDAQQPGTPPALAPAAPVAAEDGISPQSLDLNERGAQSLKAKDFKAAEELFRKSLAADAGNVTAAYNLAGVYLINKKEAAAISILKDYLEKYPKDVGLRVRLGDAYFGTKKPVEARREYETAMQLDPSYLGLPGKLATVYLLENRSNEAEGLLEMEVENSPKNIAVLANLGNVYLGNGKPKEAVAVIKRALQIKGSKELYVSLGTAYEQMNDFKNALIAFKRAVDLGETRDEVKKKIAGLEKAVS